MPDEALQGICLDSVRAFWNAAERIHPHTMQTFYERFSPFGIQKTALKTAYGLAENVGCVTFSDLRETYPAEQVDEVSLRNHGIARPVAGMQSGRRTVWVTGVGRPCPGISINILSSKGRLLADGHVGEIALVTPSRMNGYLGNTRATKKAMWRNLLRTGDLGYTRGNELFWVGRLSERINVRGQKIDPSDFERVLWQVSGVRQGCFAAFGIDDEKVGTQRIVIVTEAKNGQSQSPRAISAEIRRLVLGQLGVTVDDIVIVRPGTLTKTSSGKRRHRHFRKLYKEGKLSPFKISQTAATGPGLLTGQNKPKEIGKNAEA